MKRQIKIIPQQTGGVVKISEDTQFNKIKADKVIVRENVTARLFGMVNDIVIEKGARLFFHGAISGIIDNRGGEIHIYR